MACSGYRTPTLAAIGELKESRLHQFGRIVEGRKAGVNKKVARCQGGNMFLFHSAANRDLQHSIATALKLISYRPNLDAVAQRRKVIA